MKLNRPSRTRNTEISFNTPEPIEAEVLATPEIPQLVPNKPKIPPLMKFYDGPTIPNLQLVEKKRVELAPPESVVETPVSLTDDSILPPALRESVIEAVAQEQEIPKLVVTKDTGAPPVGVTDIPRLDAYNKMEVVHLLIG